MFSRITSNLVGDAMSFHYKIRVEFLTKNDSLFDLSSQEIQLDELLTHEIQLEDAQKAFELLKQPNCVKVLIKI